MTDWPGTEEPAWPGTEEPQQNFFDMPEADRRVSRLVPNVANIMKGLNAFGEGFSEGMGPEQLGLNNETPAWQKAKNDLIKYNIIPKDVNDYTNPMKPFMAFNEGIIRPLAVGIDTIARSPMALYRGAQSLAIARGVPPDIASIPDAFMGSPHPLGIPQVQLDPPKPFVKPVDIKPIEGSPNPGVLRTEAAKTGDPLIDEILDHPTMKAVIEKPVVDDSHTIPNSLGGSIPVNNPTLYRDKDFPKTLTIDGVTFDTAEPSAVHENVEEFVIDALTKSGMDQATALKVAFWNFGELAEDAWYRAHGMDPEHVEARYTDILNKIASRKADDVPPDLFKGTYPDGDPAKAGPGPIDKPTPQEVALGRQMLEKYLAGEGNPSGIVAFHGSPAEFTKFGTKSVDVSTEEGLAERYRQGRGEDRGKGFLYQVSVKASPDDFLNLDKPLSVQSEQVKGALTKAGIALGEQRPAPPKRRPISELNLAASGDPIGIAATIGGEKMVHVGDGNWEKINTDPGSFTALEMLPGYEKGIQDYRVYDSSGKQIIQADVAIIGDEAHIANIESTGGTRALNVLLRTTKANNPEITKVKGLRTKSGKVQEINLPVAESGTRLGMDLWDSLRDSIGADAAAAKLREAGIAGTSREHGVYSVFDPNILQITHVNGQPILDAARDLGVTGSPKSPLTEGKPAEAAARITDRGGPGGPAGPAGPGGGGPAPGGIPPEPGANPWRDRFEHFVGKLETPDDVKQLIRESADEKGEFPVARQGDIPLAHVEAIAEAAGVESGEVNQRGLGRLLKNDAEVRTAMQLMLQVTENVKTAARDVRADGSPENLIKLQEAIMRRDLAVEQVVGLRAEWGRTGNVFQEFLRDVKDQEGLSNFLKDKGRTPKDLKDIADAVDALDRSQAARVLNDLRSPTGWDKFMWHWVNALISGPITHAKYVIANAAFAGYESAVITPVAGVVGTVRRSLFGGNEGVYAGEAAARLWGLVAGTPDAIVAAAKAARTGLQTPLPGEVAQNILPKQNKGLAFQQKPIEGPYGTFIGLPSRGAAGIHSFYNFLGYRSSMEAQAYRAAAKEGLSPIDQAFWERRQSAVDAPTKEMMDNGIEEGYRGTYISELSPAGKLMSRAIKATKVGQLLLPFTHIPFNILSRGLEGTPAAFLTEQTRSDLFGKNGAVKQDMAVARLVAGSAVGAWAVNLVLNDRMTGYGPTDPKERAQWIATGHQPYSIRIGDEWYSFNRFGSLGTMLGLHANLAEAIPHLKPDSEELTKALVMTVHSTGRLLEDEVGMQGLAGLIDAINDPERKGTRFVSAFAGSLLPYSSALRQTASAMDPEMREVKSFVDGLRYYIPVMRQDLLPKRDWLGEPFTNAGYGGDLPIPGMSSIIQHRPAEASPIAEEMKRLDLHPAVPVNRVGGVQLPPKLYDQYQMAAGQLKRQVLYNWIAQPNWYQMPEFARAEIFRRSISAVNQQAGAMMQGMYPQIIQQGVQQRVDQINGVKPTKLRD